MTDDDLTIPTFLRRGHPDCIVKQPELTLRDEFREGPTPSVTDTMRDFVKAHEMMHQALAPRKLTGAFRSRVAMAVIAQVRKGADTFGKIRKALPDYDDRELKSGIRYAEKWMPMLDRRGSKRKPIMHQYQARLERDGRRYRVVTY